MATLRQQQAAATRIAVVAAARRVFAERGYAAATIADIAGAAGVAVPTVYKLYGSKRGLLSAASDAWAASFAPQGDDDLPPHDPNGAIAWLARFARRQWESGLDLALIYAGAVASQPEVAEDLAPRAAARDRLITLVASYAGGGKRFAALAGALTLPELYRELVRDRGWSPQAYEQWLADALSTQLSTVAGAARAP